MSIYNNTFFPLFLSVFLGLSTLVKRLDSLNYSTVYYMFDGNNIRDFGSCDMSNQLSIAYRKNVVFWPCPQMKVSRYGAFGIFYALLFMYLIPLFPISCVVIELNNIFI